MNVSRMSYFVFRGSLSLLCLLLSTFHFLPSAGAAAAPQELQTPPTPSGWVIFEKLGRGLGNVAFGWVELPGTIERQYREHDAPSSFFSGLFIGFAKAVGRTAVGAYETVTFVVPQGPILPPLTYFKREHPDWKLPK